MTKKISIGVTGFSRAGKTVFIGSLVQALLTSDAWSERKGQGPLARFSPVERGQFISAQVKSDLNTDLPQFPFRKVRESLVGISTKWPMATEGISRIVVEVEFSPRKSFIKRPRKMQIELIDFPGEWLIDLPMLDLTYEEWSRNMLVAGGHGARKDWIAGYLAHVETLGIDGEFDEGVAEDLADLWRDYLQVSINNGYVLNQPGRLLRPDALRHSPILRLVPLPDQLAGSGLWVGMEARFKEYKTKVIKPFYKKHFSKIDRQIVLVDLLRAIQLGEPVFDEMAASLGETLQSFNYGKGGPLSWLVGGATSHVLFAATKCDHVTRGDRANIEQTMRRMLAHLDDENHLRASSLKHDVMAISSIKVTEDRKTTTPPVREVLFGLPKGADQANQYDPGGVPLDFPPPWGEVDFEFYEFQPMPELMNDALYEGFHAINLGRALEFLIGDDFA